MTVVQRCRPGRGRFANATIEDFVVAKSNGDPLFVLAGVVDDRDMRISHVIRAEEHLPTTPEGGAACGRRWGRRPAACPPIAHLPVLVNEKRQKISKRRDRVAIEDYRAQGFLPEAMDNYLALLGWSPGDGREFFTLDELVAEFDLSNVNHSPAFFDQQKLLHFNGVYLRALPIDEFVDRCRRWAAEDAVDEVVADFSSAEFVRLAPLVQERAATLSEAAELVEFLFVPEFEIDDGSFQKAIVRDAEAASILAEARERLEGCLFDAEVLEVRDLRARRRAGTQARQGPGADPCRCARAQRRAAAVRVARGAGPRPDSSPHRCRHGETQHDRGGSGR